MKVAFICGPYRARTINGIIENIQFAEKYAKKYWKLGYCVLCPHKNTALFDGVLPDDAWLEGAKEMVIRSDVLVAIPGWRNSNGGKAEVELANRLLDKDIIYDEEML